MYYMNSNNITMHKFGIENNYISMAMNTMLGKTNNTVKSMNISETNAMVIDLSWVCILAIAAYGVAWLSLIGATGGAAWILAVAIASVGLSWLSTLFACHWMHDLTNPLSMM